MQIYYMYKKISGKQEISHTNLYVFVVAVWTIYYFYHQCGRKCYFVVIIIYRINNENLPYKKMPEK